MEPMHCCIKAYYPMLEDSKGHQDLTWSLLTGCGKTVRVSIERGQKPPKAVSCCGAFPVNPLSLEEKHGSNNKAAKTRSPAETAVDANSGAEPNDNPE
jgi:hypothetical protein